MRRYYPALIHKEPTSDYGISFPDFPGCISAGSTAEDALTGAAEALALHLQGLIEDHDTIPAPTEIETIRESADAGGLFGVSLVPVVLPGRTRRLNITLDEDLVDEIDAVAPNRSAFLATAARAALLKKST